MSNARRRAGGSRVGSGSGGGGPPGDPGETIAIPTIGYDEKPKTRDSMRIAIVPKELPRARDRFSLAKVQSEFPAARDRWLITAESRFMEQPRAREDGLLVADQQFGRSGTPDTDLSGDAWTDAYALIAPPGDQTNINHGNDDLHILNLAVGQQRGFMKWNLASLYGSGAGTSAGWVAQVEEANGALLRVQASNVALALATTLTFTFIIQATNPFTESTITHANAPTGTTAFTKTIVVASGGAYAAYTIVLTQAELNSAMGDWLWCIITSSSLLDLSIIKSRDNAVAADRPKLTANLRRT